MLSQFEKTQKNIDSLAFDIMAQAPRFMAMLNGFVLQGNEIANFPRLTAIFMIQEKIKLAQPDAEIFQVVKKVIDQIQQNRETATKVFSIPHDLLESKYKGCGNGIVVIDKSTQTVVDFDYTSARLKPQKEQNISMTKSAGKKIREDEKTITYRANFSSCQVCLF
jgi:hypothetical protein